MAEATPKPKVDMDESEFATGGKRDSGPIIKGTVEYTDTHLVIRVPRVELTYANSRPTTKALKRAYYVVGDATGREGLPGLIELSNGEHLPVRFGNPGFNLFFSPSKD